MKHSLSECEYVSTEYQDICSECGPLTACICLASIVQEWQIESTGQNGAFAYRYEYTPKASLIKYFGYADTYRAAMDSIAHSVNCEKVGA